MWASAVLRGPVLPQGCLVSYLLNGWGKEFWRSRVLQNSIQNNSVQRLDHLELGIINLNVHFFLWVRDFFVLHRMVGRTWRGVLTPGYFEPCNFPSDGVQAMGSHRVGHD
ncbi:unnamed protein product [Rangifer tarandus platyrhynchus]|uniref:Uncharacterized protein n=2 Tax=Rangifer tarandus platyrhynchus TaxID=3082113 RepID=A0AC59ZMI2_RANTA|nr:unnamed protein product [Rangifer tarandus platyrhynchus]